MTELQIKRAELEEKKRNNREMEAAAKGQSFARNSEVSRKAARDKWERVHGGMKAYSDIASNTAKAIGSIAAANDPSWYNQVKGTVEQAGKLPFALPSNKGYTPGVIDPSRESATTMGYSPYGMPGLMSVHFIPTIGRAQGLEDDPINRAATKLYTYIRSKNAGSLQGDRGDFIDSILAGDQLFMIMAWIRRALHIATKSNYYNYAYPAKLITDLGLDYDDLSKNRANYIARYNTLVAMVNNIPFVSGFKLYDRHAWLCEYIWKDRDGDPAQLYYYTPYVVYRYNSTGGGLTAFKLNGGILTTGNNTLGQLMNFVESMYNAILANPNIVDINVQILKAFPESNLLKFQTFEAYPDQVFAYSKEVLEQFHNAFSYSSSIPAARTVETLNISQASNGLVSFTPSITFSNANLASYISGLSGAPSYFDTIQNNDALDSIQSDDPTPDNVMVMSRFKHHALVTSNSSNVIVQFGDFASEIISHYHLTLFCDDPNGQDMHIDFTNLMYNVAPGNFLSSTSMYFLLYALSTFKYHPRVIFFVQDSAGTYYDRLIPLWDMNRLGALPYQNLTLLNNIAVLSLFQNSTLDFNND